MVDSQLSVSEVRPQTPFVNTWQLTMAITLILSSYGHEHLKNCGKPVGNGRITVFPAVFKVFMPLPNDTPAGALQIFGLCRRQAVAQGVVSVYASMLPQCGLKDGLVQRFQRGNAGWHADVVAA